MTLLGVHALLGTMKKLLFGLIAFMFVLGAGITTSLMATEANGGIGGYPGGANVYPHNTGACSCGQYPMCRPAPVHTHNSQCSPSTGCFLPPPY